MDRGKPVVIVGGGIIGTAIAFEIARRGQEAILVERDLDPQGASAFSFASLSAFDEPQNDVYLLKSHGLVAWREWAKEFGNDLGVSFEGELRWAEEPDAARRLAGVVERATERGYSVRRVAEQEIVRREPAARPGDVIAASLAVHDGLADPVATIDVLRDAFVERGGAILIGRASLSIHQDGLTVRIGDDRVEASKVVVATGAETTALLERMGWDIPMEPSPGFLAVTKPIERFLRGTVYVYPASGPAVHLRQLPDGRLLLGERAQDEVAKEPTIGHARKLLDSARRSFPIMGGTTIDHFTVEWRPMPRDAKPVLGPLPGLPSLYVATGHSGVTIAPAVARFVAEEIVEGRPSDLLASLRPTRFSAHAADAARSVEEAFTGSPELFLG